MDQSVDQRLTHRPLGIVRDPPASHSKHDLFFAVARSKSSLYLVDHPEQWPAEELIDLHPGTVQNLKGYLVSRKVLTQGLLLAEKQQAENADRGDRVIGAHRAQSFGQVDVGEVEKRSVPLSAALLDAPSKPGKLERVEILPGQAGHFESGIIQSSPVGLERLHFIKGHRQTLGCAVMAQSAP